ncbi:MAG: glycine dehydrogenase, partial [Acidimicrobiia bacterium]
MPDSPATTFADRHVGPRPSDVDEMLATLGVGSLAELIDQAVPRSIRATEPLSLPPALSEQGALARLRELAGRNRVVTSLIGLGYHGTITPGVIRRNVIEDPAWYTAYTPYQPEISQGRLEALLNFQTMVAELVGLDIANASMLDEGTAAAEAMTLCRRSSRHEAAAFFVDADCHPQTVAVVATRAEPLGIEVVVGDPATDLDPATVFGALVQHPGSSGRLRDLRPIADGLHTAGGLLAVATDLLACCLLVPPGEQGADVVVGSSQRFGVPMGFGGPHAGFLATTDALKRAMPGRLVGVSVDAAGRPATRLALQTREQHIRREKATSNICTAQVLLAVVAAMYATYHGPAGLTRIAEAVHGRTVGLARSLRAAGVTVVHDAYFDTLTASVPGRADQVLAAALDRGLNLRRVDADTVGISLDETSDDDVVARVAAAFGAGPVPPGDPAEGDDARAIPSGLRRTSP